jgi:hypothetical protein
MQGKVGWRSTASYYSKAINDRSQLRKNCFLVRDPEDSNPHLAINEVQHRRKTSNAVPKAEIRAAIELNVRDLKQLTNSLAISSRVPSHLIEGRLHPVANSTKTG